MRLKGGRSNQIVWCPERLGVAIDLLEISLLIACTQGTGENVIFDPFQSNTVPQVHTDGSTRKAIENIRCVRIEEPIFGGKRVPHALGRSQVVGLEAQAPHKPDCSHGTANPSRIDVRTMLTGIDKKIFGIIIEPSGKTAKCILPFVSYKQERERIKYVAKCV